MDDIFSRHLDTENVTEKSWKEMLISQNNKYEHC